MVNKREPSVVDTLSVLTSKILSDVTFTNEIGTLVDMLGSQTEDLALLALLSSLTKVYEKFLKSSWMFDDPLQPPSTPPSHDVTEYQSWMRDTYNEVFSAVSAKIQSGSHIVQDSAFATCLGFLTSETVFVKLPRERMAVFIENVLLSKREETVDKLSKEVSDLDWKYAALRAVERFSKKYAKNTDTELSVIVHRLLASIDVSECFLEEHRDKKQKTEATKTMFHICKAYNSTWIQFLKMNKSRELYHTVLSSLHEKVIPFMQNPKLLIDFLVDSYDLGGTSSLLALNSLFILITQYNLDYPSFYDKLYRMLTPDLFHTTYLTRFLSMLDLFLKSSLLPAYLVAAFVKRLSRHALQAPPHVIIMVLRLITNLMKLHPSVKRLVHRGPEHPAVREDPFVEEADDPAESNALDSSLWELEILADHYCPATGAVVKTLRKPTDAILVDLGLSRGMEAVYKEYSKMWTKDPPLEFTEPVKFEQSEMSEVFTF